VVKNLPLFKNLYNATKIVTFCSSRHFCQEPKRLCHDNYLCLRSRKKDPAKETFSRGGYFNLDDTENIAPDRIEQIGFIDNAQKSGWLKIFGT
jgi:hypothetical protein